MGDVLAALTVNTNTSDPYPIVGTGKPGAQSDGGRARKEMSTLQFVLPFPNPERVEEWRLSQQ
jgi:hypothetical protein